MPRPRAKADVTAVVATLRRMGKKSTRDGMARYGIPSDNAFGIPVGVLQKLAKQLGRNHELALALWDTEWYEARMLAAFLDEPERVTSPQMDRWCRDFDSWAICDTVCFHLFDRTPYAFDKVERWATRQGEFAKRAAFALLACLALHDKQAADERFVRLLPLVERGAGDERNFVKKGVSWALRLIGRRSADLHDGAVSLAKRLAGSALPGPRWVGKDVLKDLLRPAVVRRTATKRGQSND